MYDRPLALRVCTGYLAPHVRSVIESVIFLLQPSAQVCAEPGAERCDLMFFDRIVSVDQYLQHCTFPHPRIVYVRGFEAYAHAFSAEHVLDRPLRPSAVAAILDHTLAQLRAGARRHGDAGVSALQQSADALLTLLAQGAQQGQRMLVEDRERRRWLVDFAQRRVTGDAVEAASVPSPEGWSVLPLEAWSGAPHSLALERWLYWLLRACTSPSLWHAREDERLQLERATIAASDGKDFVRLTVIFQRGASAREASAASGLAPGLVRGFLNVNHLLGKLRSLQPASAPAPASAPQAPSPDPHPTERPPGNTTSTAPRSIFARLLQKLFAVHVH